MMVVRGECNDAKWNRGENLIFNLEKDVDDACALLYLMFIHSR
jgi:hypothetical protein